MDNLYVNDTERTTDYRETNLGLLPEGWEVVELGDVVATGPQNGIYKPQTLYGEGTLIIRIDSFGNEGGTIKHASSRVQLSAAEVHTYGLQANDVIVNRVNSLSHLGKTVLVGHFSEPVVFESNMMRFSVDTTRVVPEYVSRFLSSLIAREQIKGKAKRAVAQSSINQGDVKTLSFLLPSLSEQQAIVYILRTVQKAIEATEQVIEASIELKRSLMNHLFTYGPVPVDEAEQVPLKKTEVGSVPGHWQVVEFGKVVSQTQYGLSKRGETRGAFPILRMNNLRDGQVVFNNRQYVELDQKDLDKYRLNQGDLLFNRTNSYELVGKTGLFDLDGSYVFASYLIRVVTDEDQLDSAYANYYLNSEQAQARLKSMASRGVSQSNINATKLKTLLIPLPPLHEQQEISGMLRTVDEKLATENNRRQTLHILFKTLLHNLMTGRIRAKDLNTDETVEATR